MTDTNVNVAALVGSRICHDLINPVGAVKNGLELLALSGIGDSPEFALVNDSAADANARIKLFRLAFGSATDGQTTGGDEIQKLITSQYSDDRIKVECRLVGDLPRKTAQAIVLAVLCVEQSLPFGGTLHIGQAGADWIIASNGMRTRSRSELWAGLSGETELTNVAPADVQYLLLRNLLRDIGRSVQITPSENGVTIQF